MLNLIKVSIATAVTVSSFQQSHPSSNDEDYELIILLPHDAIPAIDNPPILTAAEAIAGPLVGQQLQRLKSTIVFWFGWKDFYPETHVYGVDVEN
jgi:hypothetical protein